LARRKKRSKQDSSLTICTIVWTTNELKLANSERESNIEQGVKMDDATSFRNYKWSKTASKQQTFMNLRYLWTWKQRWQDAKDLK